MYVRLLCLLCAVWIAASATGWSLVQESPSGVCVSNCARSRYFKTRRLGPIWAAEPQNIKCQIPYLMKQKLQYISKQTTQQQRHIARSTVKLFHKKGVGFPAVSLQASF
jgi:hypothetical protein